jgi:arginine exporter protein ArgO
MVVLGSATADVVYGAIALYGIAPALEIPVVHAAFNGLAVLILWALAYLTWQYAGSPEKLRRPAKVMTSGRWAYSTGFLLGMSNPPIIASWLFGAALAIRLGVAPTPFAAASKAVFIAGAVVGAGLYLSVLAIITYRVRQAFSPRAVQTVYQGLAVTLLLLSIYFAGEFVAFFLR